MDTTSDWVFPWDSDALGERSILTLGVYKDFYVARVCSQGTGEVRVMFLQKTVSAKVET